MYEDNNAILSTRFPQKLWKIVNESKTSAIKWNNNGTSILLDYKKFHEQYLNPEIAIFKTSNITSFIRQLNLYGFRKVTSHNRDPICNSKNPDVHEFSHEFFNRERGDLLTKVCRKAGRKIKQIPQQQRQQQVTRYLNNEIKENRVYERQGLTRLQMCQVLMKKKKKSF